MTWDLQLQRRRHQRGRYLGYRSDPAATGRSYYVHGRGLDGGLPLSQIPVEVLRHKAPKASERLPQSHEKLLNFKAAFLDA